jgi:hypothetical protein
VQIVASMPASVISTVIDKVKSLVGAGGGGGTPGSSAGLSANQALGQSLAASIYGWVGPQWEALKSLWIGESGWNERALNASSGAYGIPQSLPAAKMAAAGGDWRTNPATQIRWGMGYIHDAYGSPLNAYAQWTARSPHWYDDGGYLPPGISMVANGTGKPEPVFTSAQWDTLAAGGGGGQFTGTLVLDSGAFLGQVRGEIRRNEGSLVGALAAGTGNRRL